MAKAATPQAGKFPANTGAQAPAWPADRTERRAIDALMPYARNARLHSPAQVAEIAASIRQWGWTMPVLVDEAGEIIAGHGRVLAAQMIGLATVPTMVARGWSPDQIKAYRIADNKLSLNAAWDGALLTLELGDLKSAGFDLGLTGFNPTEANELFAKAAIKAGLTDPDAEQEPPTIAASRLGDVWLLGKHRLICGDCTDEAVVAAVLDGERPLLMVTDPPYGVDYDPAWRARLGINLNPNKLGKVTNDDRADWREAWALFPGDVAYVWHAGLHASKVEASLLATGFELRTQIIWTKDRFAMGRGDYHWQHEPCWYAVRKGRTAHYVGGRSQSTRWDIAARDDSGVGHGTQKPVECMRRPIENNSRAGQAVYEPFCGSGTTIIAAEQSGRTALAIEIEPRYVDVAVTRWEKFTGQQAMLASTMSSFAEIAADRLGERDGTARPQDDAEGAGAAARQPA